MTCEDAAGVDLGMTNVEADEDTGFLLADAKKYTVIDLEARRHHCVHRVLAARQVCEEANVSPVDGGSAQTGPASADQEHAQGLLCAAVRELEETDALLEQARQENESCIIR
ncbi:hypothetical protein [Arthrobacter roseus]|uniref:hypothetical protein n=1 Tax=Arthrobacter roseus TaxID=136274 RepID=UPI0019642784|nr:hypothetical protein [Arthrobacter roseus]